MDATFPFSILEEGRVVQYYVNGHDLLVSYRSATTSALDGRFIKDSRDIGSTGVFDSNLDYKGSRSALKMRAS